MTKLPFTLSTVFAIVALLGVAAGPCDPCDDSGDAGDARVSLETGRPMIGDVTPVG